LTNSHDDAKPVQQGNQRPRICRVPSSVRSEGADAVELCSYAGLALDDWQGFVLQGALGLRDDGLFSAFEVALVVSRQNGKSTLLAARLLVGLFMLKERELIFSSYQFDSALVVFRRLVAAIEDTPEFSKRIKRIAQHHGGETIETKDGGRVSFRTRTKLGGRGHSCDLLVFDESHILSSAAHGSLLPMVSARRKAQVWFAATAPDSDVNTDSVVLAQIRERAVRGEDCERLAYYEWSTDVESPEDLSPEAAADPQTWREANPALNIRISEEQVERERQAMDEVSFAVERCGAGRWPRGDGLPGVLAPEDWRACEELDNPEPVGPIVLAFDVSPDREHAAIAASWWGDDEMLRIDVVDERRGTAGIVERLDELSQRYRTNTVLTDAAGPAASLLTELHSRGVNVTLLSASEYGQACGLFYDQVRGHMLRYRPTDALNNAVEHAEKRTLGEAWAWSRNSSSVNITGLCACTFALWQTLKDGPGEQGPLLEWIGGGGDEVDPHWGTPLERGRRR
jgi:hypothetical protein